MKAFILAAGLGTRLQPLTNTKPKALIEIAGKTLLELTISRLVSYGIKQIIINVHHFADQVKSYLKEKNNFGIDITLSDERKQLLDTGGGLKKVSWYFDDGKPFLIHNTDVLTNIDLGQLINYHKSEEQIATLAVQKRKSSRYFLFDNEKNLCGWENVMTGEKKITRTPKGQLQSFAFSGIQIAEPKMFNLMPNTEVFSIVDLYLSIASNYRITYFDHTNSIFVDLGKKENLIEAEKILNKII